MNIQGRVISDPNRFQKQAQKITQVNSKPVQDLGTTQGLQALDQELQKGGKREIFVSADHQHVVKFKLDGPSDRNAFLQAVRAAAQSPDNGLEIKFKASLTSVYTTIMATAQTEVAQQEQLDQTVSGLVDRLKQRIPNSLALTRLEELLPRYQSASETLDVKVDAIFANKATIIDPQLITARRDHYRQPSEADKPYTPFETESHAIWESARKDYLQQHAQEPDADKNAIRHALGVMIEFRKAHVNLPLLKTEGDRVATDPQTKLSAPFQELVKAHMSQGAHQGLSEAELGRPQVFRPAGAQDRGRGRGHADYQRAQGN